MDRGQHRTMGKIEPFAFTEARIRDLEPPAVGRLRVYDSKQAGLLLCITAKGARSFRFLRKVNGRAVELGLGAWPGVTVDTAREAAAKTLARYVMGEDPAADRRALRRESTLGELWTWFNQGHVDHLRASTAGRYRDSWRLHLEPDLGARRLTAITRADVQAVVDRVDRESGPGAARHMIAVLSAMLHAARADTALGFKGEIVTQGLRRPKVNSRARFIEGNELPRFFAALTKEPDLWRAFWSCCLFLGLRRGNVASAKWSDLRLDTGHWSVPEERSKTGALLTVPITGPALAVLKAWRTRSQELIAEVNARRRRMLERGGAGMVRQPELADVELEAAGGYLFPAVLAADRPSKHLHIMDPKASWARILKEAKLQNLRPHDLRRSIASWMALGGVGLNVIGAALGHKDQRATAIYARLNDGAVRTAMERATTAMLGAKDEE